MDYRKVLQEVQEKVNSSLPTDRKSFARVLRESKGDIIEIHSCQALTQPGNWLACFTQPAS